MTSRYGSQLLTDRLPDGPAIASGPGVGGPESVVTPLAGFERSGSGCASFAPLTGSESVVTPLAGFASARRPQPPGERTLIPAAFR